MVANDTGVELSNDCTEANTAYIFTSQLGAASSPHALQHPPSGVPHSSFIDIARLFIFSRFRLTITNNK